MFLAVHFLEATSCCYEYVRPLPLFDTCLMQALMRCRPQHTAEQYLLQEVVMDFLKTSPYCTKQKYKAEHCSESPVSKCLDSTDSEHQKLIVLTDGKYMLFKC